MKNAILLLLASAISASAWTLPSTNSFPWLPGVTVGVQGGIPNRTTIFTNMLSLDASGATDCKPTIQAAVNACPADQVVLLPAGTFQLQSSIAISGMVLRGNGPGTILRYTGADATLGVIQCGIDAAPQNLTTISSGYVAGSTSIVIANTTGYLVGQPLNIYQTNSEPFTRNDVPLHQIALCTGISGNTLSFVPPLCWGDTNVPAFCAEEVAWRKNTGIENLRITWGTTNEGTAIFFDQALNCWVKGVEIDHVPSSFILGVASLFCEVRNCYIHDAGNGGANAGNGIQLYGDTRPNGWLGCSGWLIENNALVNLQPSIILSISASRNAILYNYSHGGAWPPSIMGSDININHQGHDFFNLVEGNIAHSVSSDGYHGSASHSTVFRNWLGHKYPDPTYGNQRTFDMSRWSYHHWGVGNILGDPSVSNYVYDMGATNPPPNGYSLSIPIIFRLGYPNLGNSSYDGSVCPPSITDQAWDSVAQATTYRIGNYDYQSHSTVWNDSLGDHTLPDSLAYAAQPSWWANYGATHWPPFGPDILGLTNTLPAQMMLSQWSGQPAPTTILTGATIRSAIFR